MGQEWVDDAMKAKGIILVSGEIDVESATGVCKEIVAYNDQEGLSRIQMVINSPGGNVYDGFAIIEMMEWSKLPVYTTGIGMIASMGLMIFLAGEPGKRLITPRTAILSHRFFSRGGYGTHGELVAGRKEQDLLHERIITHYLARTKIRSRKELERTLLREVDAWLTPEEALRFGVADLVEPMHKAG